MKKYLFKLFIVLTLLMISVVPLAQNELNSVLSQPENELSKLILQCSYLDYEAAEEKSSCFDKLTEKVLNNQMAVTQNWNKHPANSHANLDDVFLYTLAVQGGTESRENPLLAIRCFNKQLNAFIVWNTLIGETQTKVTYLIGSQEQVEDTWYISDNGISTIFSLKEIYNIEFIEKLLQADKKFLIAAVQPQNSDNPIVATFNISGLNQVIEHVIIPCE